MERFCAIPVLNEEGAVWLWAFCPPNLSHLESSAITDIRSASGNHTPNVLLHFSGQSRGRGGLVI